MESNEVNLDKDLYRLPIALSVLRTLLLHNDRLQNQVLRIRVNPSGDWTKLSFEHRNSQTEEKETNPIPP